MLGEWICELEDFGSSMMPLVCGLWFMPTLDEAYWRVAPRPLTLLNGVSGAPCMSIAQAQDLVNNLMYSVTAVEQGRWWTSVSYMFVHANAQHLFNNLFSLVPSAFHVYHHFGNVCSCISLWCSCMSNLLHLDLYFS
jgi:membrane associated rhomboid family serine protease